MNEIEQNKIHIENWTMFFDEINRYMAGNPILKEMPDVIIEAVKNARIRAQKVDISGLPAPTNPDFPTDDGRPDSGSPDKDNDDDDTPDRDDDIEDDGDGGRGDGDGGGSGGGPTTPPNTWFDVIGWFNNPSTQVPWPIFAGPPIPIPSPPPSPPPQPPVSDPPKQPAPPDSTPSDPDKTTDDPEPDPEKPSDDPITNCEGALKERDKANFEIAINESWLAFVEEALQETNDKAQIIWLQGRQKKHQEALDLWKKRLGSAQQGIADFCTFV